MDRAKFRHSIPEKSNGPANNYSSAQVNLQKEGFREMQ